MDPGRDQEPVRPDIWGDAPAEPTPHGSVPLGRLDPDLDPDRYRPGAEPAAADLPVAGPLDMAQDPDRYRPGGLELPWEAEQEDPGSARGGRTLPGLLGDGAHEDERDNAAWALGLIGMIVFLGLVAWLFGSVIEP